MIELTSKYADYILLLIVSYILIAAMVLLTEEGEREGKFFLASGFVINFVIAKPMLLSGYSILSTLPVIALGVLSFFAVYYIAKFIFNKRFRAETLNVFNESRFRELAIIAIYFISMILIIYLLTITKNDYLSISSNVVAILNLQILIAKVSLIISAVFLTIECIQLYIKNK